MTFINPTADIFGPLLEALDFVKMISGEASWTLWYQNHLKSVLRNRVSHLAVVPCYAHCCPCGSAKEQITMIKVDASQFFKNACINRGIERIEALLDRVQKSTGYSSVAIMWGSKMSGCLCKPNKRHSHSHQTISFHEIKS